MLGALRTVIHHDALTFATSTDHRARTVEDEAWLTAKERVGRYTVAPSHACWSCFTFILLQVHSGAGEPQGHSRVRPWNGL